MGQFIIPYLISIGLFLLGFIILEGLDIWDMFAEDEETWLGRKLREREKRREAEEARKRREEIVRQSAHLYEPKYKDWRDHKVDFAITFDDFESDWLDCIDTQCHDFTEYGFLYDSRGVYGFDNWIVGFKSVVDCVRYRDWLSSSGKVSVKNDT